MLIGVLRGIYNLFVMLYIVFFSALREREMRGRERDIYSNLSSLTLHSIVMLWKDFSHDGKFASRVIIRLRQIFKLN